MKLILLLSLTLFFISGEINSQTPFQFGRISASEMDLEYYREKFPGEPAIVIGDIANCRFGYDFHKGFQFNLDRKIRIIILSEAGLDYGNFSIPYYGSTGRQEEISRFRAHVFNIEDGRVRRTRVRESEGFIQERQNNWKELSFALPEIKVGSVIEVRYRIISDFLFQLRDWRFQREIPVLHSDYSLNLPSFFIYYGRYNGLVELDIREQEDSQDRWRISHRGLATNIMARSTIFRWAAFNIPPMKPEPFTDNIRNYQARIFFELTREQWPDQEPKHYSTTWEDVYNYLANHRNFGLFLNEKPSALWKYLPENLPGTPEESMWKALEIIHENVRWNNNASFYTNNSPQEVLNNGTGNSAEVNLLLVAMLRNLGLESYPVAVSTVSNGSLFSDMPTITQWNYVVALVKLPDGEQVLLDATVPRPIPGYLPPRAINGRGRALDQSYNEWVNLESNIEFTKQNIYNLVLNDNGDITGTFEMLVGNYGKYKYIQEITGRGEESFWNQLFNEPDIQLSNKSIEYEIMDKKPIKLKANIHIPSYVTRIGNEFIIPAIFFETISENVFQSKERQFPVTFDNTVNSVSIFNLELGDNMKFTYVPEKKSRRWGRFSYQLMTEETDTGLKITWLNHFRARTIPPQSYPGFRAWYSRMVEDNNENILVKVD